MKAPRRPPHGSGMPPSQSAGAGRRRRDQSVSGALTTAALLTGAALLVVVALLAVFFLLAGRISPDSPLMALDQRIIEAVISRRTPVLDSFFWIVTLLGNWVFLGTLVVCVVIALFAWGFGTHAALVAGAIIGAQAISSLAKHAYGRPRPPEALMLIGTPSSNSFPSGHALVPLVFYASLVLLACLWARRSSRQTRGRRALRRIIKAFALLGGLIIVTLIGLSRVYLGVHWPSDIPGGWCLGGAWGVAALTALGWWWRRVSAPGSKCPLGNARARVLLAVVLIGLVVASYVAAALLDPLVA